MKCIRIFVCEKDTIEGHISANLITDIFYISNKKLGKKIAFNIIRDMMQIFEVVNIDKDTIYEALESGLDDFEDAIQLVCAKKIAANPPAGGVFLCVAKASISSNRSIYSCSFFQIMLSG